MKRTPFLLCSALLVVIAAASSCTKTEHIVDTQIVHDTLQIPPPEGPAWVRFISMLPSGGTINLWRDAKRTNAFASALSYTTNYYLPIPDTTALTLFADYYVDSKQYIDSINIGKQLQYSLTSVVLYQGLQSDGTPYIDAQFVDDSTKLNDAPAGQCYIRFINGMTDYPTMPALALAADVHSNSIFHDENGQPLYALGNGPVLNYTAVACGPGTSTHWLYAMASNGEAVDSISRQLTEGRFYTVREWGRKADGTNRLSLDAE